MNTRVFVLLAVALAVAAQNPTNTLPVPARDGNTAIYVGFDSSVYGFSLPDLSLIYNQDFGFDYFQFGGPGSYDDGTLTFSYISGTGTYYVDLSTNSVSSNDHGVPPPVVGSPFPNVESVQDEFGNTYTHHFVFNDSSTIQKKTPAGDVSTLFLSKNYNSNGVFLYENGVLYFTATTFVYRGSPDYDYYAVNTTTLTIVDGPVSLPRTGVSGCPVPPRSCAVDITGYVTIVDGTVVYVSTKAGQTSIEPFNVTVTVYKKSCGFAFTTFHDFSAPAPTATGGCAASPVTSTYDATSSTTSSDASSTSTSAPSSSTSTPATSTNSTCAQASYCAPDVCACNGACYSPTQYCCPDGQLTQIAFCGSSTTPATSTDPTCAQASYCAPGACACNGACYSPDQYCCPNGQLTQIAFCAPSTSPSTFSSTFAPSTTTSPPAVGSTVFGCNECLDPPHPPQTCCYATAGVQCFNATTHACTSDNLGRAQVCYIGTTNCGVACYVPGQYHCTKDGDLYQGP